MDRSKIRIILFLLFIACPAKSETFKFYVKNEPLSLSPTKAVSGESNYVHSILFRGLTRYNHEGMVVFEQAERCRYIISIDVRCKLKKDIKYSDGSLISASDYATSFLDYLTPGSSTNVAQLLFSIKNAKKYYLGQVKREDVGIKVLSENEIQFLLEEEDREFLDKLSHPLLVPYKDEKRFNGPFVLHEIVKGKKWILKPNSYFVGGNPKRPDIEILFISDDSTAVNLYEKGKIDFLWRVPTDFIDKFKDRKDFFQLPVARFDYIGFNQRPGKIFNDLNLRKKFATHVDFDEFKKLLSARGRAGCPGLGDGILRESDKNCQSFTPGKEKLSLTKKLVFNFSQLGGDDIQKQTQWLHNQWKSNLNVNVSLKSLEQKTFIKQLKEDTPDIFRKGLALQWPSCGSALSSFRSDAPENFTGFSDPIFDRIITPFRTKKLSRYEKDVICAAAVKYLFLDKYVGIPLGLIHFSMMLNPKFKNLRLNDLNQIDLSELSYE